MSKLSTCKVFIFLLAFLCVSSTCFAYGSPDYLPDGTHPRIWLDSTELTRLRAAKVSNSTEWQALDSWLSSNYPATNYDVKVPNAGNPGVRSINWDGHTWASYRGLGWLENIVNYALAYQILKSTDLTTAEMYGNHCVDIVNGMIAVHSVGEETDNGILMMRAGDGVYNLTNNADEVTAANAAGEYIAPTYRAGKYGYPARAMMALPIAYDWLYDLLSPSEKALWQNVMFRYFDWVRGVTSTYNDGVVYGGVRYHEQSDGVCNGTTDVCTTVAAKYQQGATFDDPGDNFWSGFFGMMLLTGVATYGDNADAAGYYAYAKDTMWENTLLSVWNSTQGYKGGDASEGWNYGGGWFRDFEALIGFKTATGYNPFDDTDFPREVIQSYIQSTASNLEDMQNSGQWSGSAIGALYKYHVYCAMAADQEDGGTYSPYAQWFLDNATFNPGSDGDIWEKLVFYRPDSSADPTANFPLYYDNDASGLVAMRSSWTNSIDTISSWWQLGHGTKNTHENYDEGHFSIIRGNDKLLWDDGTQRNYNYNSVIDFGGYGQYPFGTQWYVTAPREALKNTDNYLYVKTNLEGGYHKYYYNSASVDLYKRSMIYIKPNIWIISDVTHINNTDPSKTNLWADWITVYPGTPSTDSATQTVSFTNGSSKAFVKTIYPEGVGYSVEATTLGHYRAEMRPSVEQAYNHFIHTIEATGSSDSQTSTTLVSGTNTRGAKVGSTVAMFTSDQSGSDISAATYTTDATTHYIADLPVNTNISVTRAGTEIVTDLNSGDAGIIEFTAASGSAEYVLTSGSSTIIAPPALHPLN